MVTYVNDLRLSELATGEGSGTWGTTTNTNLELIGEALGYGTEQSFSSDADATTTIGDGVSDPARAMYFKVTSAGSLTATRTLTIAPNTVSRVMFIENATSGSQSIAISQGSGASVTILTGKTAVVYLDGAGATAAVVDAMSGVDPGVTDTLTEVLVAGNTSGGTNIELSTTDKVQFRDAAIYLNSSVDGQLDIVSDTEIQIAATTIDVNGTLAFDSLKGTGATTVTNILDEDNMASDSATAIATQQSIKAYVDSQVGSFDTLAEVLAQGNTTGGTDLAVSAGDDITFTDTSKAIFGAGSDLQIGHDGSVSFITDSGTGDLYIQGSSAIRLTNPAGNETFAVFNDNGAASLYYDNGVSLSTTATGIDVTGSVTADGLVVDGASSGSTVATFTANANVDTPLLVFQRSGGAVAGKIAYDDTNTAITFGTTTNHEVRFLTNNTEKMQLTADGNVGIGTDSPAIGGGRTYNVALTIDGGVSGGTEDTGALEVGGSTSVNDRLVGSISYFNRDNSGADATTRRQVAIIEARSVTSDSNAGEDSGANLTFSTKSEGGSVAERLRIDASGNAGLGVVPSAWVGTTGLQLSTGCSLNGSSVNAALGANSYYDGTNWKYIISSFSTNYYSNYANNGSHVWQIAPSGTAAATITYTNAMVLDASGNLLVGKATTALATAGLTLGGAGFASLTRSGAEALNVNRLSSDGDLAVFYKDSVAVGSIGTKTGNPFIVNASTGIKFTNEVEPCDNNGADADTFVDLGSGSNRFGNLYLSGGVYLGGTGAANLLDDYEEGTWTPAYTNITGSPTSIARYTKVGSMVTLTWEQTGGTFTSTAGTGFITGIPFLGAGGSGKVSATGSLNATTVATSSQLGLYNADTTGSIYVSAGLTSVIGLGFTLTYYTSL
jgi:hypothetical protein